VEPDESSFAIAMGPSSYLQLVEGLFRLKICHSWSANDAIGETLHLCACRDPFRSNDSKSLLGLRRCSQATASAPKLS